jgi:single-strand DNA-binding protein
MSINQVILSGRLAGDPEAFQAGEITGVNFSVVTETYKKNTENKPQYHKCVAWSGMGGAIAQYFKKGDGIVVTGEIDYDSYEKDGQKKYITKINVDSFDFGAKKRNT